MSHKQQLHQVKKCAVGGGSAAVTAAAAVRSQREFRFK